MKPQLWVIAGPNGAGKSTLADRYIAGRIPVINPDNIAYANPGMSPIQAGKLAIAQQNQLLAARASFAWETTMSGKRELHLMTEAKAAGYKVNLVFVGIRDPSASLLRITQRVAAGRHDVPPADVQRRFQRCMENLPGALQLADRALVFDNSGERRRLVLSQELQQTKRIAPNLPKWLVDALPSTIRRSRGIER